MDEINTFQRILAACAEDGSMAGIKFKRKLQPVAGTGDAVNPARYPGNRFHRIRRCTASGGSEDMICIHGKAAQARAMKMQASKLGAPEFIMDFSAFDLPPHLDKQVSSFSFPHGPADAWLVHSAFEDGSPFRLSEVGKAILDATPRNAHALIAWFPTALLSGFWQSHRGSRKSQAKLARIMNSSIWGIRPVWIDGKGSEYADPTVPSVKSDPLNLPSETISFDKSDIESTLEIAEGGKQKSSEAGFGQAITAKQDEPLAPVHFESIEQTAWMSFAGLRTLHLGDGIAAEQTAAARALIAAFGMALNELAFGRPFHLRSGTDFLIADKSAGFIAENGDDDLIDCWNEAAAKAVFDEAFRHARSLGVPLGGWNQDPVMLKPSPAAASLIAKTYPDVA